MNRSYFSHRTRIREEGNCWCWFSCSMVSSRTRLLYPSCSPSLASWLTSSCCSQDGCHIPGITATFQNRMNENSREREKKPFSWSSSKHLHKGLHLQPKLDHKATFCCKGEKKIKGGNVENIFKRICGGEELL